MNENKNETQDPILSQTSDLVHLHNHSEFSSLDGGSQIKKMPQRLKELGMNAMALTDHGFMNGIPEFYETLKKEGMKPILGNEIYLTEDRFNKAKGTPTWHLTLFAENNTGYNNLCKISSWSFIDGVIITIGRPRARADWDLLRKHSEGIIALTGCMASPVMGSIFKGDYSKAKFYTEQLIDIFGINNVFGEIQNVGIVIGIPGDSEVAKMLGKTPLTAAEAEKYDEVDAGEVPLSQDEANGILADIAKEVGIELVATGDTHYLYEDDAQPHDTMICIGTGQLKKGPRRFSLLPKKYHMRSAEDMLKAHAKWPESITNTKKVALRCNVEIEWGRELLPRFPLPEPFTDSRAYLRHLCLEGYKELYHGKELATDAQERLDMELDVISNMGFNDYFLIVWDLFNEARNRNIPYGPGRGCLTGDVPVWTTAGFRPLEDIKVGDAIMTHTGMVSEVLNFFEYDVEETLLEIKSYYGDHENSVKLTTDHKVLVEKGKKVSPALPKGKVWESVKGNLQWLPAEKIEVGDLVAIPRPKFEEKDVDFIDLASYVGNSNRFIIKSNSIIEKRRTNKPYKHSVRALAREEGLTRSTLKRIISGNAGSIALDKILPILTKRGFSSVEEWSSHCEENQFTQIEFSRFIEVDNDFSYLMGRIVADGWVRKENERGGIAEHSEEPKGKNIPDLFKTVWGFQLQEVYSKTSKLVQYEWNSELITNFYKQQLNEYKHNASTKHIPEWMLFLPENKRQSLLDGLWSGDGCTKGKNTYTTVSDRLAGQVRTLLWTLGIPSGIRKDRRSREDTRQGFENTQVANQIVAARNFETPGNAYGGVDENYIYMRVREVNDLGIQKTKVYDIESLSEDHSYVTSSFAVHNSAAGSIVAYTLGITQLCPLENGLLFERFLNPDRKSMPDIDMDFAQKPGIGGREELIEYAREKYNKLADCETAVAQIVTFQKYKPKGAIRDSARMLAEPTPDGRKDALKAGDKLASFVPDDPKATMDKAFEESPELGRHYRSDPFAKEVLDQARWLEGFVKTYSLHAAAVLIASHDLTEDLPLQKFGDGQPLHVQYDMSYSEKLGLLKMDFLGLRNLDIIWDACEKIKKTHGVDISPYKLHLDDKKTYEMFARGDSTGTFQFESGGMQNALKEVGPTEFNDLVALVALYRPGPMAWIPVYADRKKGKEEVTYLHPKLEEIQGETYGITVYQEQSMIIARELAGFTPGQADDLRKAIGKKLKDKMELLKKPFLEGCQKSGLSKKDAETLWADNEAAADYSFNKAHAACYAFLSYITGYLKANYPHEYMAALLSSVMGKKDKPRQYLTETKRMGLRVLPPDVNHSLTDFTVVEREGEPGQYDILFPLRMRGVGEGVVHAIREEREANGPFTSFYDLVRRMPQMNKTTIGALAKSGAFDATGDSRKGIFETVEDTIKRIKKEALDKEKDFTKSVKERYEELLKEDAVPDEKGKIKVKLTAEEKKAIEGSTKLAWKEKGLPEEDALLEAVIENINKEILRVSRAEARSMFTENTDVGGISSEESDDNLKENIENYAQEAVKRQITETKALSKELIEKLSPMIIVELVEREERSGMEAMLLGESDPPVPAEEWPDLEKLNHERSVLEIYVSGHPLESVASKWKYYVNKGNGRELGLVSDKDIGNSVRVVGAIVGAEKFPMRSGEYMHRIQIEDLSGSRDVAIFPRTLEGGLDELVEVGRIVCLDVAVQEDTFSKAQDQEEAGEGENERAIKLIASRIYKWDPERIDPNAIVAKPIDIEVTSTQFNKDWVDKLRDICKQHPGAFPIRLILDDKPYKTELLVKPSDELRKAIRSLLAE